MGIFWGDCETRSFYCGFLVFSFSRNITEKCSENGSVLLYRFIIYARTRKPYIYMVTGHFAPSFRPKPSVVSLQQKSFRPQSFRSLGGETTFIGTNRLGGETTFIGGESTWGQNDLGAKRLLLGAKRPQFIYIYMGV